MLNSVTEESVSNFRDVSKKAIFVLVHFNIFINALDNQTVVLIKFLNCSAGEDKCLKKLNILPKITRRHPVSKLLKSEFKKIRNLTEKVL